MTISGTLFNGIEDDTKEGYQGTVEVNLINSSGKVIATVFSISPEDGTYTFIGVKPGTYQVQFVAPDGYRFMFPDAGGDDTKDSDVDPNSGTVTLM